MVRLVPYNISKPRNRDMLVGTIVKVIANYSETLDGQANLSSLSAQDVLARKIVIALDEGKWIK